MADQPKFQFKAKHGAGLAGAVALILIPFLNFHEGEKLTSYQDVGGIWTACHGITAGILPHHTYTQSECDEMDRYAREQFMLQVMTMVPSDIEPETLAAYTSFAYNIGMQGFSHSTTMRLANAGDIRGSCEAMLKWYMAGGRDCRVRENNCFGVWQRRQDESDLCLKGVRP